ncbi:MAG: site-specific DNA-methyltransferase [Acidaminococcaceae bacterium]|nr:site-specific DNA-methyltransferase [Acidaminococcaceae bacterium]
MPTLEWIGKEKVINHDKEVPFKLLDAQYTFDEKGKREGEADSGNMIIHGDNLLALKALLPKYQGKVKCIYIDPPYNTGNEGWVYNDKVSDPQIKKWLGEVVGKEGEDLSRHDKWLCMMYPRLKLLQQLLAEDGAIFISIGDDEFASLKLICDEIFGSYNFIATFVWKSRAKPSNTGDAKVKPQNDAEYIVCYGKSEKPFFRLVASGNSRNYPHHDEDGNYRLQTILKSNRGESKRETMTFELNGYKPPLTKRWQAGEETIKELFARNRITFQTGEPMLKYYEHEENAETAPFYCYVSREDSSTAENGKKLLNNILGNQHGFDTVKPIEIVTYLLKHMTDSDSIVLDSFAGSGTTAHAVLSLNKKDGGNRKFILVEMMDYADSITAERVKRVINGYGEGEKTVEGTGGSFTYYELGESLFDEDGNLNANVPAEKIREYVWYMETKLPLPHEMETANDNAAFLGVCNHTAYYFHYDANCGTTLDHEFLSSVRTEEESYVIYADACALSDAFLTKNHIIFKKIPRDIERL